MESFAAYEPVTLRQVSIKGNPKDRLWVGVIDGIIIVGNKIIITDFKPRYHQDLEEALGKHMANVFPQLTALGLLAEHQLDGEMEVWCMPYNKDGAYLFKPKWMFNELETFFSGDYCKNEISGDGWAEYHIEMDMKDIHRDFFDNFRDWA